MSFNISGIIVAYNAGASIADVASRIMDQVSHLVVVDNGSEDDTLYCLDEFRNEYPSKVAIIKNTENMGLAHALNQGVKAALMAGSDWVLTLDHDSRPAPDMVARMLSAYDGLQRKDDVAIIAARPVDRNTGLDASFFKFGSLSPVIRCGEGGYIEPDIVITSGSMVKASVFREEGLFDERLFIDCIDYEYCLRLKNRKRRLVVACDAILYHSLGRMEKVRFLGRTFYPTNHPAPRWYYMARNRVFLYTKYWKNVWFVCLDAGSFFKEIMKVMLFESEKLKKFSSILRGLVDGALGRV
jgi:rhamnosyltransferase